MAKKRESRQLMTLMPNKIGALEELFAKTRSAVSEVEDDQDIGFLNEGLIGVTLDTELDIEALIDEAIADRSLASRDLKFDDSQMPRAKNFLEWCTGRHFLKADPYLEQALIGVRLFAEYCPRCSDVEWMDIDNHEPQEGLEGLRQHVTCMEHGHCPKCGVGRAELLRNKELKFYNELAVNAGQRCVTGDTHVFTSLGIERIGTIGREKPFGFSRHESDVFNGTALETSSDFYKGREERVWDLKLSNSYILRGTGDHPVWTTSGFKTLGVMTEDAIVPVYVNQQCWGNLVPDVISMQRSSRALFDEAYAKCPDTNKGQLQTCIFGPAREISEDLYTVLGLWVAEGRDGLISNMDADVNAFVYKTLTQYISKRYVKISDTGVKLIGYQARAWLASLLGCSVSDLTLGSERKSIPETVLKSPKSYVCAFLRGLFEGDGTCSSPKGKKSGSVSYASISKTLSYDVYSVLINLGILPRIRERMTWATNGTENQVSKPCWNVGFTGLQNLERFAESVGFMSDRKNNRLSGVILRHREKSNVPYKFENYSFLKPRVSNLLSRVQSELSQFELAKEHRRDPDKYLHVKSKKRLGLYTVFGRSFSDALGCRWDKLFCANSSRALTKSKLLYVCDSILRFGHYLSTGLTSELNELRSYCADDTFLLQVKSCKQSSVSEVTYDFTLPKTHKFITQGVLSHNSGKSILVAMLSSYITHQILKVQRPTEVLGIGDNTILHGTFVALTQKQAMDTLWEPYYGYLLTSPWFQKYHALIREYERKYGVEVMKIRDTFVLYRHRSLVVYPAGPDKRVLRGRTRIFSATDEIGWFDNNEASAKVKTSAREVHIALDRSLLTVRAEEQRQIAADFDLAFTGYNFNISSPSHARDKINELVRLSQGSDKILGLHAPTWKMNPKISQESLSENFKNDPVGTWRDYGAVAPLSANPFITQMDMINDALREKGRNLVQYNTAIMRAKDGSRTRYATVTNVKETDAPSIMAIDAGYSNNSFALVVGSYDEDMCISADVLVEIMPLPGIPLNYSLIFEHVMKPLFAARNVKVVLADRWQSIKILQDSSPFVEVTRQYSLKYADFWTIKALLEQNTVSLPRPLKVKTVEDTLKFPHDEYPLCFEGYPTEHLMLQFATVQDSGSQVLKGTGYTDDLWRALCLMCWGFESTEFEEELTRKAEVKRNRDPSRLGVSKGRSNSSGANLGLSAPTAASSAVLKSRR